MTKKTRYSLLTVLTVSILILAAVYWVNNSIKNKVEHFINNRLTETIVQSYDDLSLNVLEGTLTFSNVSVAIKNKDSEVIHTQVNLNKLVITDISYWQYLVHNTIHIDHISLKNPTIRYKENLLKASKDTTKKPMLTLFKPIEIDEISIENATLQITEDEQNTIKLYTENASVAVKGISITSETLLKRLPVTFESYEAEADSIFVKMNAFENLSANNFVLKNKKATLTDIILKTKYSKTKLSEVIQNERDYYDVQLKTLTVDGIDFGFKNRKFFAKSTAITLDTPSALIFRDKLVADDPTHKKLYSRALREVPFDLSIDAVKIKNGTITYQERTKKNNLGGTLLFKSLDADIKNINNTSEGNSTTTIAIKALFMKDTPFTVDWSFDIQDVSDHFTFKTSIGALEASDLNPFTEANLRVRLTGKVLKTYVTIDGNRNASHSDMKINYNDFKIAILNKSGREKNKLLSTIANLFVSKNSKNEGYSESAITATPDKTKSFFNYIWVNIMAGLTESLTGGGL
ncbi:DUF748 domain-containing protein [Ulvibacter litoralis]|uniref:DUF748 domain-containing protein n=1 Tax=Ulvibacter litoralis TaxID=227084 RepID=A0A1G7CCK9_9FLAO|nr:DUF748 domain-containing protein [Ulvibacter litoralis]GHC48006.1 hypothetical protein GCM10008083_09100 [Ulvibacter litoralis]SDE36470.1 protein of unknown function [Ulvibacter litoralis]